MGKTDWRVYQFGNGAAEGDAGMSELLGGKGANLAEMSRLGLPVPPGFTLPTNVCHYFNQHDGQLPDALRAKVSAALKQMGPPLGVAFGDADAPLLVSVRSGSRASMPGMMDTVLNLGLNDKTVTALAAHAGDARFAWDSYRRFIQMYGDVVMGVSQDFFEEVLDDYKLEQALTGDADLEADDWQSVVERYLEIIDREADAPFPQDPMEQIWGAIAAVFRSWNNARAITYRRLHNIPDDWGTAVTVQAMVFGNLGETSATGVAFTRNPSTGENEVYGEFLPNAQGEDVVAGLRTPLHLTRAAREHSGMSDLSLQERMPEIYDELVDVFGRLEAHFGDMQDVEFTVQEGKLFILQTRSGKRTTRAAIKIAVDMVAAGQIDDGEALLRLDPSSFEQLLHPTLDPSAQIDVLCRGLPASPGAASGKVCFSADIAEVEAARGEDVILVRMETSPEDIHGMYAARAILTSRGGMTSHAAVVARGLGRPCVSGAGEMRIDYDAQIARIGGRELREGDVITIDGASGRVMQGRVPTLEPELSGDFGTIMTWAGKHQRMQVRANAETIEEAKRARRFGAAGIGLCRTEHMFFNPARILQVRRMILAQSGPQRDAALAALEPEQRADFAGLLSVMAGLPVTIRLLDPPLHEFLPSTEDALEELSELLQVSVDEVRDRIRALHEANPMLGHRGSRLAVTAPEIYAMQLRALFGAMHDVDGSEAASVEIMLPLISTAGEITHLRKLIDTEAAAWAAAHGFTPEFSVGSMIEVPGAALSADALAHALADQQGFFSFGTNDLTQTTLGLSRDDAGSFMSDYLGAGLFEADPFTTIAQDSVGVLMQITAEKASGVSPSFKLGLCGEHGGDPESVAFCDAVGIDYVSCSPFRVPIARLAAARAHLLATRTGR
ncbi:MAG: pyruvate, phosphate dikinase [Rhodobiaceae bacterium]|nr:pyruvate, phosphate dikinase [Rhodobiaceae bacterium]OUT93383.1 MAG: pyruvate, phosphate dikinase [Rhizobiales bacterium TMED29]